MLKLGIVRTLAPAIALAALFFCSPVRAAVFVDYFTPTTPQPEPFSVNPGDALKSILATESSEITITGGEITNLEEPLSRSAVRLLDNAKATISGSHMSVQTRPGVTFGTPVLHLEDESETAISDGLFESFGGLDHVVNLSNDAKLLITGGRFVGHNSDVIRLPFVANGSVLTISGGEFVSHRSNGVDLSIGDGIVNIVAREVKLDGSPIGFGPVLANSGILSVVYGNRVLEDISFRQSSPRLINLVPVPEPSSFSLSIVIAAILELTYSRFNFARRLFGVGAVEAH